MIYRFLSAQKELPPRSEFNKYSDNWDFYRFGGAWREGALSLGDLPTPNKRINPKAKFYFTEEGFHKFGKYIIADAKKYKQELKVIRRKNPKKSQIVYKDKYQVAIIE